MSPKPREGNGGAPPAAAESIDQVRDLLFGSQMRMVDVRLQSLDERLARDQRDPGGVRAPARGARRLDQEGAGATGRADGSRARQAHRGSRRRSPPSSKEALRSLEKRHHGLEEAAGQADAELRDQLLKHSTAFAAELGRTSERLSAELERITSALPAEKLDASSLIAGLTELAELAVGPRPPANGQRAADAAPVIIEPPEDLANGDGPRAEFDALRRLLVGPEQHRLDDLAEQVRRRELTAEELAERLPDAIALRSSRDDRLGRALSPTIETALRESIRRNPRDVASAIFPVLGPAIRKAVAEALSGLVRSINTTIDQSFSVNGIKWRLEAWRTGVPYPEIVLKHALVYRVEQAFLVHAETGLAPPARLGPRPQAPGRRPDLEHALGHSGFRAGLVPAGRGRDAPDILGR